MIIDQRANFGNKETNLRKINSNCSSRLEESVTLKLIEERIIAYNKKRSNVDESSNSQEINNTAPVLHFFDQWGQGVPPLDISAKHICVISSIDKFSVNLIIYIIHIFLKANVRFEIINGSSFHKLSISEQLNTSLQYLVWVDIDNMNIEDLPAIDIFCAIKFIFKLPGLEITPSGVVDRNLLGHLIWNLNCHFPSMKQLIASLSEDEFMVLSDDDQSIRCLRDIEKVFL